MAGALGILRRVARRPPDAAHEAFVNAILDLRRGRGAPDRPSSLTEFLRARGGVRDVSGDLGAIYGGADARSNRLPPGLIRTRGGLHPDDAALFAVEARYPLDEQTPRALYDALDGESRGQLIYPAHEFERVLAYQEWQRQMRALTQHLDELDPPIDWRRLPARKLSDALFDRTVGPDEVFVPYRYPRLGVDPDPARARYLRAAPVGVGGAGALGALADRRRSA